MSEEVKVEEGIEAPEPSAVTKNTEPADHMIPKSRFDEVNKELRSVKAKLSSYEQQQMSEAERLQAQTKEAQEAATKARTELQAARAEVAVARAAATLGVNPTKLARLVTVEFDSDGQPVNVEAAAAAVLNDWPELKQPAAVPGATNPSRERKLTIDDIRKMTPEQINSRWSEVQATLAGS